MKNLIKLGALASLVIVSFAMARPAMAQAGAASDWTFQGNVTGVSDYVFRGISLSDQNPAVQPSFTVSHSSGFYGNVWGSSNDDFNNPGDGINKEVDYTLGWSRDVAKDANIDLHAVRYTYPGSNPGFGIDYNEYFVKATFFKNYFAMFSYANDYANSGHSATYYQIGGSWGLGETGITVNATAGYSDLNNVVHDSYYNYLVGLGRNFGPINLNLSFIDTSSFGANLGNPALADSRLVLTASWNFNL